MYLGSQTPMYQNVHIKVFDEKTGRVRVERNAKNRITKLMLWGIAQFLSGNFNNSNPDKIYEYIPRYLAFGTNQPGADADTAGVSTSVTVLDSRLLDEYKYINTDGSSEAIKRVFIQGRQHSKISTNFTDPHVKLTLSAYINSERFNGLEIGEAGLFSKEYDNNCLARVVFPPFRKNEGEVIDVQWEITILSYGTTKYPESIQIEGPGTVIVPITYTPYYIDTKSIGLVYADNHLISVEDSTDSSYFNVFNVNADTGIITASAGITEENLQETEWAKYLTSIDQNVSEVFNRILTYRLDGWQFRYAHSDNPGIYYLGDTQRILSSENYLQDSESFNLQDSENFQLITSDPLSGSTDAQPVLMSFIYEESVKTSYEDTGIRLEPTSDPDDFTVVLTNNDRTTYKIVDNEVFKIDDDYVSGYNSVYRYLYHGLIIDQNNAPVGYGYDDDGVVYEIVEEERTYRNVGAYLAYQLPEGKEYVFGIYRENLVYDIVIDTGYWIDWTLDKEVYNGTTDTLYHITNDNYFAIGETYRLSAYIQPSDATDKSVSWSIINPNVSKINQQGVLTAWNVGQTLAIVATSNNMRARVEVEVIKNSQLVLVDSITIDPDTVTFIANEAPSSPEIVVTAIVKPSFSTYKTVAWTTDAAFDAMCTLRPIGNNQAQVVLNNSGNVGRGRITATTLDGKSATCLVNVIYQSDDKEDCPDPFHNEQQV